MATAYAGLFVAVTLLLFAKVVQIISRAYDSKLSRIPGPYMSRFTNLPLKLKVLAGQRTPYIDSLHQIYGSVVRIAPNEVDFADLDSFHEIHRVGSGFVKSAWYQMNFPGQLSSDDTAGIFEVINFKRYAALRRQYAPAFTPAAIQNWEPRVAAKVEQAIAKIKHDTVSGDCDVFKWFGLMTFDIITALAFGENFDLVGKGEKTQAAHDIDNDLMIGGINQELPFLWPLLQIIGLVVPKVRHLTGCFERLIHYGQIAIKNTRTGLENGEDNRTIFAKMISESDEKEKLGSASLDVIATRAIGITVWLVLSHPTIKSKLLAEIKDLPESTPFSTLTTLPHLNNVIEETLRLYPAAPGSLYRVAPPQGAHLAGYDIPARTAVDTQAWSFHRNPAFFTEPLTYNPDRWLQPTAQMKAAFMPWGGNSRQCIGIHLAKMEMLHAAFGFFKACPDARVVTGAEEMEPIDYFLMKPRGLKCLITMRR